MQLLSQTFNLSHGSFELCLVDFAQFLILTPRIMPVLRFAIAEGISLSDIFWN
jgi:hypothetical protein